MASAQEPQNSDSYSNDEQTEMPANRRYRPPPGQGDPEYSVPFRPRNAVAYTVNSAQSDREESTSGQSRPRPTSVTKTDTMEGVWVKRDSLSMTSSGDVRCERQEGLAMRRKKEHTVHYGSENASGGRNTSADGSYTSTTSDVSTNMQSTPSVVLPPVLSSELAYALPPVVGQHSPERSASEDSDPKEQQLAEMVQQVADLKRQLKEAETDRDRYQHQVQALLAEKEVDSKRIDSLEKKIERDSKTIEELRVEIGIQQNKISELQKGQAAINRVLAHTMVSVVSNKQASKADLDTLMLIGGLSVQAEEGVQKQTEEAVQEPTEEAATDPANKDHFDRASIKNPKDSGVGTQDQKPA